MDRIVYRVSTALLCLFFFAGSMMYLFNTPKVEAAFTSLGFPTWIIYPLAVLKLLGVVAIASRKSSFLKELAYAGFLYDAGLALVAHVMEADGEYAPAIFATVLIVISWTYERKVYGHYEQGT